MWFVFAIQLISVLPRFQSVMSSYSCDVADWGSSLDRIGWSKCPETNTYLKGLDRNVAQPEDERVGRIENGKCCTATAHSGYTDQPANCSNADWRDTLNHNKVWALCPTGYYLNGLRLGAGPPAYLNDIDEGQCCHPQNHPNSYEHCYDEDVSSSFDAKGWSTCKQEGYYMTGFYKSVCNYIYCIEKFKCCKMKKVIDGGWSDWGNFGECSVTCGDGTKVRTRTCTNPPPSGGGANCSGPSTDTVYCNDGPCVAHSHGRNTTQCNSCLEDDFVLCANKSVIKNCISPATDSCFSVAGRYNLTSDPNVVFNGVARGCGSCPNITEGCKAFKQFFDTRGVRTLLDCNMVCCRGDLCNNQTVSWLPSATPPSTTGTMPSTEPTTDQPATAGHPSHYSPTTGVLAIAAIIGGFLLLI